MFDHKNLNYLHIGLLFLAFGLISLLVILTRQHPFWVKKKLRIGGMILTLGGALFGCKPGGTGIVTCYDVAISDNVTIEQNSGAEPNIVLDRAQADTLSGTILSRQSSAFSFAVADSRDSILQKENIDARDGAFDEASEEFTISIAPGIPVGMYNLRFYRCEKDSIVNDQWWVSFSLEIR